MAPDTPSPDPPVRGQASHLLAASAKNPKCTIIRWFSLRTSSEFSPRPAPVIRRLTDKKGAGVMHRTGQHEIARHIRHRAFRNSTSRAILYKKPSAVVSRATACAVVLLAMAAWQASSGSILTQLHTGPWHLTSAFDFSKPIHKSDRLPGTSFEERWSAVPAPPAAIGGTRSRGEAPRGERRMERIPFSCELAFSRLVRKGNFSTRCIAGLETSKTDA